MTLPRKINNSNLIYRPAIEQDLVQVAQIHLMAFPNFFLTSLGINFLRVMYKAFLYSPKNIFVVAEKHGVIQGFAAGLMGSSGTNFRLALRFLPNFIFALIPTFRRRPISIFKRLIYRVMSSNDGVDIFEGEAILRSIAVLPLARGAGIAERLLEEFEVRAVTYGASKLALTTDADDNGRAIAFYSKNKFEVSQKFYQDGARAMYLMVKRLM